MATAKKTSTASKIRNALTKYPDSKVSAVARMFNVSPAYGKTKANPVGQH